MRILLLAAMTASLAAGESHPSWWMYASPDATALVGIQWENLRQSPFAAAIQAELSSTGSLGFPDLDCLRQAREMVLSSPPLLVAEAGKFPAQTVQRQATAAGLRRASYKEVTLWLPADASQMGIAQMNEALVLVGTRKTLESAIHNSLLEIGRRYSPLLMKAARYSQTADVWIVSVQLPDPLASRFVPFEASGQNFEGAVSARDGLKATASFEAASNREATEAAAELRKRIAHGVQAVADSNRVLLDLQIPEEQLTAELRAPVVEPAKPVPVPTPPAKPVDAKPPDPKPAEVKVVEKPAAPPVPQVIRIVGLDDGPREITLPPPVQ